VVRGEDGDPAQLAIRAKQIEEEKLRLEAEEIAFRRAQLESAKKHHDEAVKQAEEAKAAAAERAQMPKAQAFVAPADLQVETFSSEDPPQYHGNLTVKIGNVDNAQLPQLENAISKVISANTKIHNARRTNGVIKAEMMCSKLVSSVQAKWDFAAQIYPMEEDNKTVDLDADPTVVAFTIVMKCTEHLFGNTKKKMTHKNAQEKAAAKARHEQLVAEQKAREAAKAVAAAEARAKARAAKKEAAKQQAP
jgi:hypothetical protein